jgi:acetyl esterase/lipase
MSPPQSFSVSRQAARDLAVDVYAPAEPSLLAGVILLHGGGWAFGHRSDLAPQATAYASHGFTAICAEYRLSPEVAWRGQLDDVADLIGWSRRNAEILGIRPDRVALHGVSAGGHLALMSARHADAVVVCGAPPELRLPPPEAGPNPIAGLLGPAASPQTALAASPVSHVSADLPPICLIGGVVDRLVPPGELIAYFTALHEAGVKVSLHLHHDQHHAFDMLPSMIGPVHADAALFLKRAMVDPAHYEHESDTLNPFARGLPPN